jgi:hypothetical protein
MGSLSFRLQICRLHPILKTKIALWSIQMPDPKLGIPFAFLLALSATESNAVSSGMDDTAGLLRAGSLRNLLDDGKGALADEKASPEQRQGLSGRITQWFNGSFNSCFQGAWRRC